MPSRWAFEGMVLLESSKQPTSTQPIQKDQKQELKEMDLAELYFEKKSYRTSVPRCSAVLAMMLLLLGGGIIGILRSRDIH